MSEIEKKQDEIIIPVIGTFQKPLSLDCDSVPVLGSIDKVATHQELFTIENQHIVILIPGAMFIHSIDDKPVCARSLYLNVSPKQLTYGENDIIFRKDVCITSDPNVKGRNLTLCLTIKDYKNDKGWMNVAAGIKNHLKSVNDRMESINEIIDNLIADQMIDQTE